MRFGNQPNPYQRALERDAAGLPPKWMVTETEFQKLITRLNLSEQNAHTHPVIQTWVRANHRQKYCPPDVLRAIGIYED